MLSGVPDNAKIATEPLRFDHFVPSGTSLSRMSPHTHSHRPRRVRMNLACGSVGWRLVVALRRGMAGEHHPRVCAVNAERQSERRTVNGNNNKSKINCRSQSAVHSPPFTVCRSTCQPMEPRRCGRVRRGRAGRLELALARTFPCSNLFTHMIDAAQRS